MSAVSGKPGAGEIKPRCPKCGSFSVVMRYHEPKLACVCSRCAYNWAEQTWDERLSCGRGK